MSLSKHFSLIAISERGQHIVVSWCLCQQQISRHSGFS